MLRMGIGSIKMVFIKMKIMNCGAGGGISTTIRKQKVIISMVKKKGRGSIGSIMALKVVRALSLKMSGRGYGYFTMKMDQFIKSLHMPMVF